MIITLFDFDGTITTDDSLIKFIRFVVGDVKTAWGMILLSPMLIIYKLKLIPNYKAKQIMLSYFFKGMDEQLFLYRFSNQNTSSGNKQSTNNSYWCYIFIENKYAKGHCHQETDPYKRVSNRKVYFGEYP